MLRPLPIDLGLLSEMLEGDPMLGNGRIDLTTGEYWPEFSDYEEAGITEEDLDDPDRWLFVRRGRARAWLAAKGYRPTQAQ